MRRSQHKLALTNTKLVENLGFRLCYFQVLVHRVDDCVAYHEDLVFWDVAFFAEAPTRALEKPYCTKVGGFCSIS